MKEYCKEVQFWFIYSNFYTAVNVIKIYCTFTACVLVNHIKKVNSIDFEVGSRNADLNQPML